MPGELTDTSLEFKRCIANRIIYPDVEQEALDLGHYSHLIMTATVLLLLTLIVLLLERFSKEFPKEIVARNMKQ